MNKIIINKEQTEIIKGIGILFIMFHNLFHWIEPITEQNEFIFNPQNVQDLIFSISNYPLEILNILLSYFGHYGVQLFIFISGYGLTISYLSKPQDYTYFIKNRVSKIYPPLLIVLLALLVYKTFTGGLNGDWLTSAFIKILMLHTLIPNEALTISGPWWFYGLIVQLYILLIPLLYVIKRWNWKGFLSILAISYLLIFALYNPLMNNDLYIMGNAPGHIPEFALGILLALKPDFTIRKRYIPILLMLFILGNFYFALFPFTFIIAAYLFIIIVLYLFQKKTVFTKYLIFYGKISMYLFAIHGLCRGPFAKIALDSASPVMTIAMGLLFVASVTLAAFIFREAYAFGKKHVLNLVSKGVS
ncbi:acyltransferase family protein [Xanthomarina gelatinilytica]|uniref:acyltransferase family protein n=1 Tax=Xanthomarina gelatinilytica TaxID=1137281 RepID=UPI003AA7BFBF